MKNDTKSRAREHAIEYMHSIVEEYNEDPHREYHYYEEGLPSDDYDDYDYEGTVNTLPYLFVSEMEVRGSRLNVCVGNWHEHWFEEAEWFIFNPFILLGGRMCQTTLHYINWVINESPWSRWCIDHDPEDVLARGLLIDVDTVPVKAVVGLVALLRWTNEVTHLLPMWEEYVIKQGQDPLYTMFMTHFFKDAGDYLVSTAGFLADHAPIGTPHFTTEVFRYIINYTPCGRQENNFTLRETRGYYPKNSIWIHSRRENDFPPVGMNLDGFIFKGVTLHEREYDVNTPSWAKDSTPEQRLPLDIDMKTTFLEALDDTEKAKNPLSD